MSSTATLDLAELDLADPRHWDDGVPYDLFGAMQRDCPVHFSKQAVAPDEGGFWSVTRFDDVYTVTRDFGSPHTRITSAGS